jgi:hypothetical protein
MTLEFSQTQFVEVYSSCFRNFSNKILFTRILPFLLLPLHSEAKKNHPMIKCEKELFFFLLKRMTQLFFHSNTQSWKKPTLHHLLLLFSYTKLLKLTAIQSI